MKEKIDKILLENFTSGDWQIAATELLELFNQNCSHFLYYVLYAFIINL